jgi:hypothetical protein
VSQFAMSDAIPRVPVFPATPNGFSAVIGANDMGSLRGNSRAIDSHGGFES